MAVRDFSTVTYMPMLAVRPAEMSALQELPTRDKDRLLPLVTIRPWLGAHRLDSALSRVEEAYGRRAMIADICVDDHDGVRRPVHDELDELREPENGYSAWCEFIAARSDLIPVLQVAEPSQVREQLRRLSNIDRGLVIRVPEAALSRAAALARAAAEFFAAEDVCVVLDFERQSRELLNRQATTIGIISAIQEVLPRCFVSLSASSFPETFGGVVSQDIYERRFFNGVLAVAERAGVNLIYGDRGSARAERQTGGGGQPAPRIDYPLATTWQFFREESDEDRSAAYQAAAQSAMDSPLWDSNLRLWGTQLIERTALGDLFAINTAAKSTAARINIHLHQQLFYGVDTDQIHDTDDDWSD